MTLDTVTEIIAHFAGIFHLQEEQSRLRSEYEKFKALEKARELDEDLASITPNAKAPYKLIAYDPTIPRVPLSNPDLLEVPLPPFGLPERIDIPVHYKTALPHDILETYGEWAPLRPLGHKAVDIGLSIPAPGSLGLLVREHNTLLDDDIILMSDAEHLKNSTVHEQGLEDLIRLTEATQSIIAMISPDGEEEATDLIKSAAEELRILATEAELENENSQTSDQLATLDAQNYSFSDYDQTNSNLDNGQQFEAFSSSGIYHNGELVEEAFTVSDYLPASVEPNESENTSANEHVIEGSGALETAPTITVTSGENLLVNEILIGNWQALSNLYAVSGNSYHLNIISQVNVWSDIDAIEFGFNTEAVEQEATQSFNQASIANGPGRTTTDIETISPSYDAPDFWAVTRLDSNLVFMNWVEQINYVSDNDYHSLTTVGSNMMLTTGGNLTANGLSLIDLGYQYDLIVIGGNYYNANVISQTNILLDNDTISFAGSSSSNVGSIGSSGNVLWNDASIISTGNQSVSGMDAAFTDFLALLAAGSDTIPNEILANAEFAGLPYLKVLYIEGDLINFQYIKQTNILGDADDAIFIGQDYDNYDETVIDISSGNNVLVNAAKLVDGGPDANIMIQGDHYSDALIHQAGLAVDADQDILLTDEQDAIVSEAVLFLADGILESEQPNTTSENTVISTNGGDSDVMQTMLA
jgi:hypothetical protein